MIVCPRCSKENQDHYKFCLGCGAELPRDAAHAPKSFTAPTPPAGFPAVGTGSASLASSAGTSPAIQNPPAAAPVASQPAASAPLTSAPSAAGPVPCPQCKNIVQPGFKFCGTCGFPMAQPSAAPPPAAAPAAAPAANSRGTLVLIRPDGSEGGTFPLNDGMTPVGREAGGLFANDSYLSPKHAVFAFKNNNLVVTDQNSLNGVYVRIERDTPTLLVPGAIFRIGQEILRFDPVAPPAKGADGVEVMGSPNNGIVGRLSLVIGRDTTGNAFPVPATGMHVGRERGDVVFPEDGYVSGLHCRLHADNGKVFLTDVGSSNGTFVRVAGETPVKTGAFVLMGQQLFRAQY